MTPLEQQPQNLLVTPKERSRDKAAAAYFWKGAEENAKVVDLGCQVARANKAEKVHSNMTPQRNEKPTGIDQESGIKKKRDNSAERQYRKTWKNQSGKEDRPLVYQLQKWKL